MREALIPLAVGGVLLPIAAWAYPDGAPWESMDDPAQACASCHSGRPVVADSPALSLAGAGETFRVGETYRLTLSFKPEAAKVAGFMAALHGNGEVGSLGESEGIESEGSAVRSIRAAPIGERGKVSWTIDWTAPAASGPVELHVAANAANDDASALGDTVHVRTFDLAVVE